MARAFGWRSSSYESPPPLTLTISSLAPSSLTPPTRFFSVVVHPVPYLASIELKRGLVRSASPCLFVCLFVWINTAKFPYRGSCSIRSLVDASRLVPVPPCPCPHQSSLKRPQSPPSIPSRLSACLSRVIVNSIILGRKYVKLAYYSEY